MALKESELILNKDGSIYHLNLKPENIAQTIIFVGDQDRVEMVTKHFDSIEFETQKREFKTQTGIYKGKRISVMSTGIGTDNIDIVLNELDALINIDFETRETKQKLTSLDIIRIGTSGSLRKDIPVDSFLLSSYAIDTTGLFHSYDMKDHNEIKLEKEFEKYINVEEDNTKPVAISCNIELLQNFKSKQTLQGITITAAGFYGPQGRALRLPLKRPLHNKNINSCFYDGFHVSNLEMETAGIYGLSKLLGHRAISLNAIIANREEGNFSHDPNGTIENLITYTLNKIVG